MKETSNGFREEYSFLSNFTYFEKPMNYYGLVFQTNEHFYQAMKFPIGSNLRYKISTHPSKGLKKQINSLKSEWRSDWEDIKLDVMLYGLRYKFTNNNPILKQKLIDTGDLHLVEYNYWNDKFWGVCLKTGEGENHLGKLLMQVRKEVS